MLFYHPCVIRVLVQYYNCAVNTGSMEAHSKQAQNNRFGALHLKNHRVNRKCCPSRKYTVGDRVFSIDAAAFFFRDTLGTLMRC